MVQFEFIVSPNHQLVLDIEFQNLFACNSDTHTQGLEIKEGNLEQYNHYRFDGDIVLWSLDGMFLNWMVDATSEVPYVVIMRIMQFKNDEVAHINFAQTRNIPELNSFETDCADMLHVRIHHMITANYSIMPPLHILRIGPFLPVLAIILIPVFLPRVGPQKRLARVVPGLLPGYSHVIPCKAVLFEWTREPSHPKCPVFQHFVRVDPY